MCSFTAAKTALVTANDGTPASIYTVAVAKGRDYTWDGAVDDLRMRSRGRSSATRLADADSGLRSVTSNRCFPSFHAKRLHGN
jgi:hypothetical protein